MNRSISYRILAPAALLAVLSSGCGSDQDAPTENDPAAVAGENAGATSPTPPGETRSPKPAQPSPCDSVHEVKKPQDDEVLVFFGCGTGATTDAFHSFARPVDAAEPLAVRLNVALTAYFAGPLRKEGPNYMTFAGPDVLNSSTIEGTRAIIDLDLDGVASSTSAQSAHIWNALRLLTFQFPTITEMEPRYNGSCVAFGGAVEAGECLIALPNGESASGP